MATVQFDPTEGPTKEQQEAEAAALAQGEKILQAQEEDRQAEWGQQERENENVELIGGKFRSQEELLKAYQELEKMKGKQEDSEDEESADEPEEQETEETAEVEYTEAEQVMNRAAEQYTADGKISDEAIEELSKMDSKDLIKAYMQYYAKSAQQVEQVQVEQAQIDMLKGIAGGESEYESMVTWAANNLPADEIDAFNNVTNSGNVPAMKFAVEALSSRYKAAEGFEGNLVTGKASTTAVKPYRSQAELARDIANPLYETDHAFRSDVEERLRASPDLF